MDIISFILSLALEKGSDSPSASSVTYDPSTSVGLISTDVQDAIDELSTRGGLKNEIVQSLPATGEEGICYFVPNNSSEVENIYDEYVWFDSLNDYEKIGSTKVDISDLLKSEAITVPYDDTRTYVVGDYVTYLGYLYRCKTAVTTAQSFAPAKWDKIDLFTYIKNDGANYIVNTKTYNSLTTTSKTISGAINEITGYVGSDNAPYVFRQVPFHARQCNMRKLIGGSVVWNQLVDSDTTSVTIASGHKYILWNTSTLSLATSDGSAVSVSSGYKFYDITQMFPSAVASFMTTTLFATLFPDYANYAYSEPTIQSTKVSGKKVTSANLISNNNYSATTNSNGTVNYATNGEYGTVKAGYTYTFSFDVKETNTQAVQIRLNNVNNSIVSYTENQLVNGNRYSKTFTATDDGYICFWANTNAFSASKKVFDNIQLQLGSTATEFVPYTITTYDLSGSHLVKRKYAEWDLGIQSWSIPSGYNNIFMATLTNLNTPSTASERNKGIICEKYLPSTTTAINDNMDDKSMLRFNNKIYIRDTSYSTAEAFTTAMNGVKLVGEIATQFTETVTNPTLYGLWLLDANNNLYFDGDEISDFVNVEVVGYDGTEEFIDAEVVAQNRDVALPCGHNTDYFNSNVLEYNIDYTDDKCDELKDYIDAQIQQNITSVLNAQY